MIRRLVTHQWQTLQTDRHSEERVVSEQRLECCHAVLEYGCAFVVAPFRPSKLGLRARQFDDRALQYEP